MPNATPDDIIDVIEGNRVYMPIIYVLNKVDAISIEELDLLGELPNVVPISAKDDLGFEELLETIWERCNMLRVYTKPKGQVPDYSEPVILHARRPNVEDFCNRIHRGLAKQFRQYVVDLRRHRQHAQHTHIYGGSSVSRILQAS